MKIDDLRSRKKIGKTAIIVSLSLCALLAFHYYQIVADAFFHSPGWPTARGNVIKSYVRVAPPSGASTRNVMPEVAYVYSVDGVNYEGNKIFFLEDGRGSAWSEDKIAKYKIEQQIEVFYNPQDPSISVLEPGGSIKGFFLSGAFHLMLIAALMGLVFALVWDYRKVNKAIIMLKAE